MKMFFAVLRQSTIVLVLLGSAVQGQFLQAQEESEEGGGGMGR